jgi:hypothetical protein
MVAKRREWGFSSIINHPIPSFPAAKAAGSNAWDVSPEDLGDPFEALGQFFFSKLHRIVGIRRKRWSLNCS